MRPAGVQLIPKSNLQALVHAIEERLVHPLTKGTASGSDDSNVRAILDFYRELTGEYRST
jgi:hypothetical protein